MADVVPFKVVAFDAVESQRLLTQRDAVIATLADVGIAADEQTATAVLATARDGVEIIENGRNVGLRPADTADIAAVLEGFGVDPTEDTGLHAAAVAVETNLAEESA